MRGGPWRPGTRVRGLRGTVVVLDGEVTSVQLLKNGDLWVDLDEGTAGTWVVQVGDAYAEHDDIIELELFGVATGVSVDLEYYPAPLI